MHCRRIAFRAGLVALPLRLVQGNGDFAFDEILAAVSVVFGSGIRDVNGDILSGLPRGRIGICRKAGGIVGPYPERIGDLIGKASARIGSLVGEDRGYLAPVARAFAFYLEAFLVCRVVIPGELDLGG